MIATKFWHDIASGDACFLMAANTAAFKPLKGRRQCWSSSRRGGAPRLARARASPEKAGLLVGRELMNRFSRVP